MAVTVTVSSIKIDITSTGGVEATWAECVTAINTHTPGTITIVGSPAVYTITCPSTYRELEISSGCIVRFEEFDEIRWEWSNTSGSYYVFEIASGSTVTIEQNVTFDIGYSGTYHRGYVIWSGNITAEATLGNEIIISGHRRVYLYPYDNSTYNHIIIKNSAYASESLFFNGRLTNYNGSVEMDNILVTNDNGNYYGCVYFDGFIKPWENLHVNGITVDHCYRSFANLYSYMRLTNCTFKNNQNYSQTYGVGGNNSHYIKGSNSAPSHKYTFQNYGYFKDCLFQDNDLGAYEVYNHYDSFLFFENCEFKGVTYTTGRIYNNNNSVVYFKNPTFTNLTNPIQFNSTGVYLHVDFLTLTVTKDGSPVEHANVLVHQSEDKFRINAVTNSDGQLVDSYGNHLILPIQEQTAASTYVQWSDSIGSGRYYTIEIYKEGVGTYSEDFTFTAGTTINAVLETNIVPDDTFKHITHKKIKGIS